MAAGRTSLGARLATLGFLFTFVASFALAGFSVVFCRSLGQAQLSCCCHAAVAHQEGPGAEGDKGPQINRAPCCESRQFDSATSSSSAASDPSPAVAPPSMAVLPESLPVVRTFVPRDFLVARQERPVPQGRAPPSLAVQLKTVRLLC